VSLPTTKVVPGKIRAFCQLDDAGMNLLRATMTELARTSGREKSNLSRTLRTLGRYGLIRLERGSGGRLRPSVTFRHAIHDGFVPGTQLATEP
jgi:DNA-binding transcriptional ArsR family regulator